VRTLTVDDHSSEEIDELIQEMNALSSYRRAEAIKQIRKINFQISDLPLKLHSQLEIALHDPEAVVRSEAAIALAFLEGEIAVPLIEPLLNDPNLSVRSSTLAALGYTATTPSDSVIEKMLCLLKDPDPEIRDRCARALGRLQVTQSISELLKLAKNDKSPAVRAGSIVALGMFDIKKHPILLLSQLKKPLAYWRTQNIKKKISKLEKIRVIIEIF
jgi:HEAT repeat protein